jgi:hypothetical protein
MEVAEEGVRAYPVTRLMKQDKDGLRRVGLDANDLGPENWQGKHEFDFETLGGGKRAPQIDLAAILLPRVAGSARTAIRPATPREAMMTMAPNNLRQLPDGWREGLAFTADVSRRLPAYHLDLGTNPDEIADVVAGIIAEHS